MPSMYLKNSQARRDLPIPGSPITETCWARPSRRQRSEASTIRFSSAARATPRAGRARPPRDPGAGGAEERFRPPRGPGEGAPAPPPPPPPPPPRHDAQRPPGADRLLAALELVDTRVLVGDRRLAGA